MRFKLTMAVLLWVALVALFGTASAAGQAYYIAPTGLDTNPCTLAAPCATLPRAAGLAQTGDTIYLRAGVYYSRAEWQISGATGITITAYPADIAQGFERPVVDATYAPLGATDNILQISNSHTVTVSQIEFRNSSGRGISSSGTSSNITFYRVWVYNIGERCVGLVGSYITLDSANVHDCALNWADFTGGGGWPAAVSSWWQSGATKRSDHVAVVNTLIQRVYGEGVICLHVDSCSVLRTALFETKSVAAYADDAINVTFDDLLINMRDPAYRKTSGRYAHGVQFGNEGQARATTSITVSNSTLSGVDNGVYFFCFQSATCGYGDVRIYNNRIDARSNSIRINAANLVTGQNIFSNNTISGTFAMAQPGQWRFDNNAYAVQITATNTPAPTITPTPTATATSTPTPQPESVRFAVVGDYGHEASGAADDVAALVDSWNVDFVITTGDNCYYPVGDQMDRCVGQFYSDYIFPYFGNYGAGSPTGENRFWPTMGNHEYEQSVEFAYWAYFTLPGNERYYTLVRGPVEFFMVNSNSEEPDGNTRNSPQAVWLQGALAASTAAWKIVVFHHPPFTSGNTHGGSSTRDWPYAAWGADAVMSGHEHLYERLDKFGIPYFVNGIGGRSFYGFALTPTVGSVVRFNADYGAQLVEADQSSIRFRAITRAGVVVDDFSLQDGPTATPNQTATPTITSLPTDTPTITPTRTPAPTLPPPAGWEPIFADGFESGNLSAWSTSIGGSDLTVTTTAALAGTYGLRANINDTASLYVRDNSPTNETTYRALFEFDPNSLAMGATDSHLIFQGQTGASIAIFQMQLRKQSGAYQVNIQARLDAGTWLNSLWYTIPDGPNTLEMRWGAATNVGATNGYAELVVDGVVKETLVELDNDTHRLEIARLGPLYGIDGGTVGQEYFDSFESYRVSTITATETPTWTPSPTASASSTLSPTPSSSPSPSITTSPTATSTPAPTSTSTLTPTPTPTAIWVMECAGVVVQIGTTYYCFGGTP